jgi:ceramide glucosyltransferase
MLSTGTLGLMMIQGILLILITGAVGFYIGCVRCTRRFFARKPLPGKSSQPVSILIPVCGLDQGARQNWSSFCQQDYDSYEVLFGVMDPQDPAVPLLKELVDCFPQRAQLIFCQEVRGINHQISNLMHLLEAAQHEVVIFADSDIRVGPDYLQQVVAPLADPAVGIVTCTYVDHNPQRLGAALAALGRCVDFIPSLLVARSLDGRLSFALGPTIATRKAVLDKIGGLSDIVNRIGSDYHIGRRVANAGFQVQLSHYILENDCGQETVFHVFQRELRWARTIRWNRGNQYYGLGFSYGTVYSFLLVLASGFQPWTLAVCLAVLALRLGQATVAIRSLNCLKLLRWLWAIPLRDIMSLAIWVAGTVGQTVHWRGRWLQVGAGGMLTEHPKAIAKSGASTKPQG